MLCCVGGQFCHLRGIALDPGQSAQTVREDAQQHRRHNGLANQGIDGSIYLLNIDQAEHDGSQSAWAKPADEKHRGKVETGSNEGNGHWQKPHKGQAEYGVNPDHQRKTRPRVVHKHAEEKEHGQIEHLPPFLTELTAVPADPRVSSLSRQTSDKGGDKHAPPSSSQTRKHRSGKETTASCCSGLAIHWLRCARSSNHAPPKPIASPISPPMPSCSPINWKRWKPATPSACSDSAMKKSKKGTASPSLNPASTLRAWRILAGIFLLVTISWPSPASVGERIAAKIMASQRIKLSNNTSAPTAPRQRVRSMPMLSSRTGNSLIWRRIPKSLRLASVNRSSTKASSDSTRIRSRPASRSGKSGMEVNKAIPARVNNIGAVIAKRSIRREQRLYANKSSTKASNSGISIYPFYYKYSIIPTNTVELAIFKEAQDKYTSKSFGFSISVY